MCLFLLCINGPLGLTLHHFSSSNKLFLFSFKGFYCKSTWFFKQLLSDIIAVFMYITFLHHLFIVFISKWVFPCVSFLQILVNSINASRPAVLYEKVTVSEGGSPLLRDMLFSPDQQYIYTLTDRQVSSCPTNTLGHTFSPSRHVAIAILFRHSVCWDNILLKTLTCDTCKSFCDSNSPYPAPDYSVFAKGTYS